uniref:Uncharacterized protein n=1 Tax=Cryptosporidium parvum TaxID=5807 RepID=F0X583_CRYPV
MCNPNPLNIEQIVRPIKPKSIEPNPSLRLFTKKFSKNNGCEGPLPSGASPGRTTYVKYMVSI